MKYEQMIAAPKKGLIAGIELCPHAGTKMDLRCPGYERMGNTGKAGQARTSVCPNIGDFRL